jgi:type II secretory pathway pseudopilin PulG
MRPARRFRGRLGHEGRRDGVTAVEVIVVVIIIVVTALLLLVAMSRGREEARMAACRNNLGHIGMALALYHTMERSLPRVGDLAGVDERGTRLPRGPLRDLLESLQLPDLTGLKDANTVPEARPGSVPGDMPVPGFVCPSDPNALEGLLGAPVSYRAVTGDEPGGDNGAFAPGRATRLQDVEAGDGTSYTAAFSERSVGDAQPGHAASFNYHVASGRLSGPACPTAADPTAWRGDAGALWRSADYRYTLYNHALPPNAQPSCVASDGKTALMGASSGHVRGVNLLLLEGRVTIVRRSVSPAVWKEFARIGPPPEQ